MGLHDISKAAPTQTPSGTGKLNSISRPQTEAEKGYYGNLANQEGINYGIDVNEYKDYTPFGSGSVFVSPHMDDTRAQNQSAGEQLWNGAVRLVGTTGTKVMSGVGYLGGFASYAGSGFQDISKMTDNGWSAYFDGLESSIKSANPIYKPSWVENGGFWDKATSLGFYMDEGVDGLAYMVSSMLPGIGIAKGLQLGTRIANIIGAGAKTAGIIDNTVITALSTISEAAQEAHGVQQRVRQELAPKIVKGEMTKDEAEVKAAEAARNDFLLNGLILVGPNALETKFFFGNAAKTAERNVLKRIVDESGKIISDVGPVTKRLVAKEMLKKAGLGIVAEGLWEENAQLAVENWTVDKATGKDNSGLGGIIDNMKENFSTTDGRVSMFLGGIMGLGGGAVGGFRTGVAEKKAIANAQARLSSVGTSYTADLKNMMRDLYEKESSIDSKGNTIDVYKKDGKGNLIVNKEKANEVFDKLKSKGNLETLKQVALLTGQKDMFETLQNISFANMAIEHLQYGEGSLDVLNKRIDAIAEENQKEYEDMFGVLGEPASLSIQNMKENQKKIGKVIYDSLEREKNFSGVWDTPNFANKEELKQYDSFVQSMIGNKALADARIAFANQKLGEYKGEHAKVETTLNGLQETLATHNKIISDAQQLLDQLNTKATTKEEKEFKRLTKERGITKASLEEKINNTKRDLEEVQENIDTTKEELSKSSKKINELTDARNNLKKDFGTLTNSTLKDRIQREWSARTVAKEKVEQEIKKQEEKKVEVEEKQKNGTSQGTGVTNRALDSLKEELKDKEEALARFSEFADEDDPEIEALAEQVIKLRDKIQALENGAPVTTPTAVEEKPAEVAPSQDISEDYNKTVSSVMTSTDELNPDKTASKNTEINLKMGNLLPSDGIGQRASTYSNVVMHKQLEHTLVNANKVRYFYFLSDEKGNPVFSNASNIDFSYVNNPESLQPGEEIEFRLTPLTDAQQREVEISANSDITRIQRLVKDGKAQLDSSDNYGYGDLTKHIGIYSNDKLIGFVQLPKMYELNSPSTDAQKFAREEIVAERKAIIERLEKGEKVTTTIQDKGKGNYFSKSKKGNPDYKNQDDSVILPEIRPIDQLESQSVYGYYRDIGEGGNWIIPDFSTKAETKKTIEMMKSQLTGINGYNGQVALMIKTANGTWSPIPVFTNTLSQAFQDALWTRLVANKDNNAKTTIAAINDLVYASIDESSTLRIYPVAEDTMINIGATGPIKLKDIQNHETDLRNEIKNLKTNLVANKLNDKAYQDNLMLNKGIVTNVVTVNGDYFLQPFIAFDSILSEEQIKEAESKAEPEVAPATETTLDISSEDLSSLGITGTGYISTLDANPSSNEIIFNKRAFVIDEHGKVKDTKGTIINTQSTVAGVYREEAIKGNHYTDAGEYRALAVLSIKNGVSKREIKIVSLKTGREISNKKQKEEIVKANSAIGDLVKKYC